MKKLEVGQNDVGHTGDGRWGETTGNLISQSESVLHIYTLQAEIPHVPTKKTRYLCLQSTYSMTTLFCKKK